MKTFLCLMALAALVLAAPAGDLSGKWTGTFNISIPDGSVRESEIIMTLKQTGTELTGTAGPQEGEQFPIRNGKVAGDKITFEVERSDVSQVIKFDLALAGDRIKGGASLTREGETRTAKVDMGRAK